MDSELIRQHEAFKKHAARTSSVQQRPNKAPEDSHSTYNAEAAKKKKKAPAIPQKSQADFDYKTAIPQSNAANFGTLAKIVDYMKKRHLSNQQWPLAFKEILDEIQVFDLSKKSEAWLKEVLPKNERLQMDSEGKFAFRPPYRIKGKQSLISVAKKYHEEAKGGILLSALNECIPNGEKVLESLGNEIIVVPTSVNKRRDKVFFWNDPSTDCHIEEDFKSLWRTVSVDHLDEKKIEDYLQKHGIDTMKDLAPKKMMTGPPKRKVAKRRNNTKVHNEHLSGLLEDYDD